VCVCACMRACVRACVCVCVREKKVNTQGNASCKVADGVSLCFCTNIKGEDTCMVIQSVFTKSSSIPSPQFMADHTQSDIELVHSALRPLLMMLGDYRNLTPTLLQRLTHMISLFPTSFNEKMCDSLMVCKMLSSLVALYV